MNDKTFYICHYCNDYKTIKKHDMKKHLIRKKKCIMFSSLYDFEKASQLSLCKTYTFLFETDKLEKKDYAFIISNYTNIHNEITENYTDNNIIFENNSKKYLKKNDNEILNKKIDSIEKEDYDDNEILSLNNFICPMCNTKYSSKHNLLKHWDNKSLCEQKRKYNLFLKERENIENFTKNNLILSENNENKNLINSGFINNGVINNIQNIQNNNNNSNFNIKVNDFMNDKYDLTHISDDFYKQKDFFIFNKFLEEIMLNKNNHNIYFIDNNTNAVVYTENELNKVSSEKVGYIVLEKVEQAFSELYYMQDDESKKYYDFINSYYRILKGQYRSDTIYKIYNVDDKKFEYTSNSNLNRARDKHLGKLISVINKYHSQTKQNLSKYNDTNEILTIEPNIENFISKRCRYKDLKS